MPSLTLPLALLPEKLGASLENFLWHWQEGRHLAYERIASGESDAGIRQELIAQYLPDPTLAAAALVSAHRLRQASGKYLRFTQHQLTADPPRWMAAEAAFRAALTPVEDAPRIDLPLLPTVRLYAEHGQLWADIRVCWPGNDLAWVQNVRISPPPARHQWLLKYFQPVLSADGRLLTRPCLASLTWSQGGLAIEITVPGRRKGAKPEVAVEHHHGWWEVSLPRVAAAAIVLSPTLPAIAADYTVRPGDTLYGISRQQFGTATPWRDIFAANRHKLANPNRIYPGMVLHLPDHISTAAKPAAGLIVRPGDTLFTLASRHLGNGAKWTVLWQANRHQLRSPDLIFAGTQLRLPGAQSHLAQTPPAAPHHAAAPPKPAVKPVTVAHHDQPAVRPAPPKPAPQVAKPTAAKPVTARPAQPRPQAVQPPVLPKTAAKPMQPPVLPKTAAKPMQPPSTPPAQPVVMPPAHTADVGHPVPVSDNGPAVWPPVQDPMPVEHGTTLTAQPPSPTPVEPTITPDKPVVPAEPGALTPPAKAVDPQPMPVEDADVDTVAKAPVTAPVQPDPAPLMVAPVEPAGTAPVVLAPSSAPTLASQPETAPQTNAGGAPVIHQVISDAPSHGAPPAAAQPPTLNPPAKPAPTAAKPPAPQTAAKPPAAAKPLAPQTAVKPSHAVAVKPPVLPPPSKPATAANKPFTTAATPPAKPLATTAAKPPATTAAKPPATTAAKPPAKQAIRPLPLAKAPAKPGVQPPALPKPPSQESHHTDLPSLSEPIMAPVSQAPLLTPATSTLDEPVTAPVEAPVVTQPQPAPDLMAAKPPEPAPTVAPSEPITVAAIPSGNLPARPLRGGWETRPFRTQAQLFYNPVSYAEALSSQELFASGSITKALGAEGSWRLADPVELAANYLYSDYKLDRDGTDQAVRTEHHGRMMGYYVFPIMPNLEVGAGLGTQISSYSTSGGQLTNGREADLFDASYQRVMVQTEAKVGYQPFQQVPLLFTAGAGFMPWGKTFQSTQILPDNLWGFNWNAGARYSIMGIAVEARYRGQQILGENYQQGSDMLQLGLGYEFR